MSGGVFRVRGRTGPAPTTVWLCKVADRINMLRAGHWKSSTWGQTIIYDGVVAANYANQWTPNNLSYYGGLNVQTLTLGAFTTAPDGSTDTAQKLMEDSTNNKHYVMAGFLCDGTNTGIVRFAGIFKGAGRRVIMEVSCGFDNGGNYATWGTKVIFDLAGGQVGVAPTTFGAHPPAPLAASIAAVADGFYRCIFDVNMDFSGGTESGSNDRRFAIYLDAGTGTGVENSTYAGDGASGIYGWKTNVLPIAAWALNNRTLFDDFVDGTATFDLTDSRAAGFRWYLHNQWPAYPLVPNATNPAAVSVANSILTITGTADVSKITQVQSACYTGDIGGSSPFYQGFTWKMPGLFEIRSSFDYTVAPTQPVSPWTSSLEILVGDSTYPLAAGGREIDFWECNSLGQLSPVTQFFTYPHGGGAIPLVSTRGQATYGMPPWQNNREYQPGTRTEHNGVFYISISDTINDPPPSANWSVITDPQPQPTAFDPSAMHTYQCLMLPYTKDDYGYFMVFCDGIYCNWPLRYGPVKPLGVADNTSLIVHPTDGQTQGIWLLTSAYVPLNVDWVSLIGE